MNNNKDNTNKINNFNLNFRDNILNNKSLKESFFSNKYVKVNEQYSYYEDIFNYLKSFKINTEENNKTKWKNAIYPKLYEEDEKKSIEDKKRHNFRIKYNSYF